jgi:hypothetical protein
MKIERQEGRLLWVRTDDGFSIEIPAKFGWSEALLVVCLAFWLYGCMQTIPNVLNGQDNSNTTLLELVLAVVTICFSIVWLLWSFGGSTILVLTPVEFTLQRNLFGFAWSTRTYQNSHVVGIRYIAPYWVNHADRAGYTRSKIRFAVDGWGHSFASGVSEAEAFALISRIMEVYEFPPVRLADI